MYFVLTHVLCYHTLSLFLWFVICLTRVIITILFNCLQLKGEKGKTGREVVKKTKSHLSREKQKRI